MTAATAGAVEDVADVAAVAGRHECEDGADVTEGGAGLVHDVDVAASCAVWASGPGCHSGQDVAVAHCVGAVPAACAASCVDGPAYARAMGFRGGVPVCRHPTCLVVDGSAADACSQGCTRSGGPGGGRVECALPPLDAGPVDVGLWVAASGSERMGATCGPEIPEWRQGMYRARAQGAEDGSCPGGSWGGSPCAASWSVSQTQARLSAKDLGILGLCHQVCHPLQWCAASCQVSQWV